MNCHELAQRLLEIQPDLAPTAVARLSLLILNQIETTDDLADEAILLREWKSASFRLQAASDQHSAMTEELENLAVDGPVKFDPQQIWILLRAIKVQSQVLELYTEEPVLA